MNVDGRLLANMIACGIQAAGEELAEPLQVTIDDDASAVYVATREKRFFRIRIEELTAPRMPHAPPHLEEA